MTHSPCAAVTYRASDGDRDLAMLLAIDPERATLADAWERLTAAFGAIDPASIEILHHVNQGLRAHTLYRRDVDYLIEDGKIKIIDEFTGRVLEGRR